MSDDEGNGMTAAGLEAGTQPPVAEAPGLELIARRRLLLSPIDAFFELRPGDHALVKDGEAVGRGAPILEPFREPRTVGVHGPGGDGLQPAPRERARSMGSRGADGGHRD